MRGARHLLFISLSPSNTLLSSFLLMLRPPPSSPLFPYTTLFRSEAAPLAFRPFAAASVRFLSPRKPAARMVLLSCCCLRSEEHTSELQSRGHLVCRLLPEKKKQPGDMRLRTCYNRTYSR